MNRKIIYLTITFGVILFMMIGCNLLNIIGIYRISTSANEPTIKTGSAIFISRFKKAEPGNFIAFERENNSYLYRVVGEENDTLEIIDGTLYRNSKNFDNQYNLNHSYLIDINEIKKLPEKQRNYFTQRGFPVLIENKYLHITAEDSVMHKVKFPYKRILDTVPDKFIADVYQQDWNRDNFGPIVIPANKVFVLGDNRENAMDSRYIGLIDKSDIKGTLIR